LDHEVTETVTTTALRGADSRLPTLAFVGAGRAGTALAAAAHAAGYRVIAIASRTPASAGRLATAVRATPVTGPVAAAMSADVTVLTVPDAAVTPVAAMLAASGMSLGGRGVVHCSGALDRSAVAAVRQVAGAAGAVHPLASLAGDAGPPALRGSFFAIDADPLLRPWLERLVEDLGGIPFAAPPQHRALYHAAAVLAGNAPLALLERAATMLRAAGVDGRVAEEALTALLLGAVANARRLGVRAAMTGPVVRNDAGTVARHLRALEHDPAGQELYHHLACETLAVTGSDGRDEVAAVLAAPPRLRATA
jgi:predicted short-subunit dehydrogenase-like oxidoreductase (DUF2520 family)